MRIEDIDPGQLFLDRQNPRFGLSEASDETEALQILAENADLKELWNSIAERGFEKFEPLVAMKENGEYVVLEGNRRLAAVKLLLNPDLLGQVTPRKKIPEIEPAKLDTCRTLPVVIVNNRAEAAGYIGFKHVNGPARWSSLAKARFGVNFYENMSGETPSGKKLEILTKQLGDGRGVILRLLVAYKIVEQAIKLGYFNGLDVDPGMIEFSHLYTLINNPDSREFIGLPRAPLNESLICDNPIPEEYHGQLLEVLGWLYGKRSVIKSQGTDRPRLQRVLASREGVEELRNTGDLASAETVAGLQNEDWIKALANVVVLLSKVSSDASVVADELGEDDLAQARSFLKRINNSYRQINSIMPSNDPA